MKLTKKIQQAGRILSVLRGRTGPEFRMEDLQDAMFYLGLLDKRTRSQWVRFLKARGLIEETAAPGIFRMADQETLKNARAGGSA